MRRWMLEGVRDQALALGLVAPDVRDERIAQLRRAGAEGTFCYTFLKAVAVRGRSGG